MKARGLAAALLLVGVTGTAFAQEETKPAAEAQPAGPTRKVPTVVVQSSWITGTPDAFATLGLKLDAPSQTISAEKMKKVLDEVAQSKHMTVLNTPKMTLISGQRGYVSVMRHVDQAPQDYRLADAKEEDWRKGDSLEDGIVLDVACATDKDGAVSFAHLEPRAAVLLGTRTCSGKIRKDGRKEKVEWEENVIASGETRIKNPCDIGLKAGEALVVPMTFHVRQAASDLRIRVIDGKVKEHYKAGGWGGASEVFLIITAARGEDVEVPEGQPIGDFKAPSFDIDKDPPDEGK